jgi:hypothetical protein
MQVMLTSETQLANRLKRMAQAMSTWPALSSLSRVLRLPAEVSETDPRHNIYSLSMSHPLTHVFLPLMNSL